MGESREYMTLPEENGSINISEEVIAAIAVGAVRDVEGVSGMMTNLGGSVTDLVNNKRNAQKGAKGVKIDMTGAALVLDIYLVFVFYQLAESRKREKEYSLIQQQSNIQLSVYRELSQKYADSVRIAHDAKKHVRALEDLVQSEQASQYRDSICAELNKFYPAFEHENPLFSVLINHALYRSERNGIRLDLRLHDADLSMLSDMDLTILFANLLDNAIEACAALPAEKRKIQLILEQEMGFLIIHITNPFAELAPLPHHKYGSTKPGHMGVGLSNVRQTVEKYHGVFSVDTDAEVFAVAITIPVAQK